MAYSNKNYFPSQVVSDAEKLSYDYGVTWSTVNFLGSFDLYPQY